MAKNRAVGNQGLVPDLIPRPDPSLLTTEQLIRHVAAERDYIDGQVALLVEKVGALDRLLHAELHDRDLAVSQAQEQTGQAINRVNDRLQAAIDAQGTMMPRAEAKLLIDAITGRLETVQSAVTQVATTVTTLRSSLTGQSAGERAAQERSDRTRTLVFALASLTLAIGGLFLGRFLV